MSAHQRLNPESATGNVTKSDQPSSAVADLVLVDRQGSRSADLSGKLGFISKTRWSGRCDVLDG